MQGNFRAFYSSIIQACNSGGISMAIFRKSLSLIRNRQRIPDLDTSITALEQWFETPLGRQLLAEEQRILDRELSCMFGYHLLQLSINRHIRLFDDSRICHCFSIGAGLPHPGSEVAAYSSLDALPLEDESVDVAILHHVLEFSHNPHQVLREASRVTIPRGYIIIFGFNPFSTMGMVKPLAQLFSNSPIWKRNSLRKGRISDWLQFLDCNTLRTLDGIYNLPLQRRGYLASCAGINQLLQRWGVPFGNFYCLVARKDRGCLTPIKPDWSRQPRFKAAKALSARSAARLALIRTPKATSVK
jgi:SAM-dependent methyltransferase